MAAEEASLRTSTEAMSPGLSIASGLTGVSLVALLSLLLVSCGGDDEEPPLDLEALTLRDALGLSAERQRRWSAGDRDALSERMTAPIHQEGLLEGWDEGDAGGHHGRQGVAQTHNDKLHGQGAGYRQLEFPTVPGSPPPGLTQRPLQAKDDGEKPQLPC